MRMPVIIPFYGREDQLARCLLHLERGTVPVEPYIRDNNRENLFFTAAVNEGIEHFLDGPAEFMLVLNQDMYLAPDAIEAMIEFMRMKPHCGIGTALQMHAEHGDQVVWGGSLEAFPAGRRMQGPLSGFSEDAPIYWASGACMILRKKMIREIGLLDANLVLIGSDSDYSFTARSRGWEVWRISAARGTHEHGASWSTRDPTIELIKLNDMLYFARKWLTGELYRRLALEGPELAPDVTAAIVDRLEKTVQTLQTQQSNLQPARNGDCKISKIPACGPVARKIWSENPRRHRV